MIVTSSLTELTSIIRGKVLFGESMRFHTSFRLGGPADAIVYPADADDISQIFNFARVNNIPLLVIGCGTNILAGDLGIRGMVVCIGDSFNDIDTDDDSIKCGAGFLLNQVVDRSIEMSCEGIEFLTKIPGTVGGAVAMNTGTHNFYISRCVLEVGCIQADGTRQILTHDQMRFDYRSSIVLQTGSVIDWIRFKLKKAEKNVLLDRIALLAKYRTGSQPYNLPNAGCAFRNPPAGYAGRLIDDAGLKSFGIGGIEVSKLHANFLVNVGSTDATDALKLMIYVAQTVYSKFNVRLVPEIRIAGSWSIPIPVW